MGDLLSTLEALKRATDPADVFGVVVGDADAQMLAIKRAYRRLARIVHVDVNGQNPTSAHEATVLLNRWLEKALEQVRCGHYGNATHKPMDAVAITSKRRTYTITEPLCAGDLCNLYRATYLERGYLQRCIAKIVREACDNPALARETTIHNTLTTKAGRSSFSRYFLHPLDAFAIQEGAETKRVLILSEVTDAYDLVSIRQRYPAGIDLRHLVWIWKRVLSAIGFAHRHGIVHGAVLPPHLLIRPADHGAYLLGWTQAATDGQASYISAAYTDWYPPEVYAQKRLLPATDIYLAAKCAIYLLGGDPLADSLPETVPTRLATFIKSCLFTLPERRPQDAWDLHQEFDETIVRPLFGAPKFIDFTMV